MSKFARAAATSQTLSLTAMEEASRMGQREPDVEHLLLALTLSEQAAGHVLRSHGVTLEATRKAIAEQRSLSLQSIGIDLPAPDGGRITFHETNGYEWSKRAFDIITRASKGRNDGDAAAVLAELLTEPSGLIEELLQRLGTSPAALISHLADAKESSAPATPSTSATPADTLPDSKHGSTEVFVPAPIEEVWALLVNPQRMSEWEPLTGGVIAPDITGDAMVGASWMTIPPTEWPDGKTVRVRRGSERRRVELVAGVPGSSISWRFTYPDLGRSNSYQLCIALSATTGGTRLGITLAWRRSRGWRRAVGFMLAPLQRFAIWMQLRQFAGGISRAFR